ncbi:hypothetical protein [Burkholderia mallei]|nr:hypothetical protein [Burkholderia mallei]RPA36251.1 hypothetical protein EGT59_19255 [Burkholderia mallei]
MTLVASNTDRADSMRGGAGGGGVPGGAARVESAIVRRKWARFDGVGGANADFMSRIEAACVACRRLIISFSIRFDRFDFAPRDARCDFVIILASGYTRSG